MRFFLDEGVPRSVGTVLRERGHDVIYLAEAISLGSPDDLVAIAAQQNNAVLVACDGDMKHLAKKYGVSNTRYKNLSLIKLSLRNLTQASHRVDQALSLIEHQWQISEGKQARRLFIEVRDENISTRR